MDGFKVMVARCPRCQQVTGASVVSGGVFVSGGVVASGEFTGSLAVSANARGDILEFIDGPVRIGDACTCSDAALSEKGE